MRNSVTMSDSRGSSCPTTRCDLRSALAVGWLEAWLGRGGPHFWANDDAGKLPEDLRAALDQTNRQK
jgi:hypothetical protein